MLKFGLKSFWVTMRADYVLAFIKSHLVKVAFWRKMKQQILESIIFFFN